MADKGDGAEALDEEARERRNFVKSVMRCRTVLGPKILLPSSCVKMR